MFKLLQQRMSGAEPRAARKTATDPESLRAMYAQPQESPAPPTASFFISRVRGVMSFSRRSSQSVTPQHEKPPPEVVTQHVKVSPGCPSEAFQEYKNQAGPLAASMSTKVPSTGPTGLLRHVRENTSSLGPATNRAISKCVSFLGFFVRSVKRTIFWIIHDDPTEQEAPHIQNIASPILRSYVVWRHSCLFLALPIVLVSVILGFVDFGLKMHSYKEEPHIYNPWGAFLQFLFALDTTILWLTLTYALWRWNIPQLSVRSVRVGWLVSFFLPLVPALFPLELIAKKEVLESEPDQAIYLFKIVQAVQYCVQLFPAILTLPSGAIRGAIRINGLLPNTSIPGWILLLCAPFHSTMFIAAVVILIQIAGSWLLLTGVILMALAPWIYVVRFNIYTDATDDITESRMILNQRLVGVVSAVGLTLIGCWLVFSEVPSIDGMRVVGWRNTEDSPSLLLYSNIFRLIFESIGRLVVTTLMFCDILLFVTCREWITEAKRRRDGEADLDETFEEWAQLSGKYEVVHGEGEADGRLQSLHAGALDMDQKPVVTKDSGLLSENVRIEEQEKNVQMKEKEKP